MRMRSLSFLVVLVLVFMLASCGGQGSGGSSPTSSTPLYVPHINKADGPFQIVDTSFVPSSGPVQVGTSWSVHYTEYCASGMLSLYLIRDSDNAVSVFTNTQHYCQDKVFQGSSMSGKITEDMVAFAHGQDVTVKFGQAPDPAALMANITILDQPSARWSTGQ
jgi:hypothetical protein